MGVPASQSIDPRDFDDRVKKTLRVWVRGGGAIRPPLGLVPTAHSAPDHELLQWRNGLPDGDDALELRSDWRLLPNVSAAVAACMGGSEPVGLRPTYATLVEAMAERLYDLGVPIPWDYANADARPTSEQARVYSQMRGAGDGRLTEGVRPALVRAREAASVPSSAPGSVATFPLECAGTSLKYVRPRPRPVQPRGDASSSSGISRCAARIPPPVRVAGAPSFQATAPSPPLTEGGDLIGGRITAAPGGHTSAPQVDYPPLTGVRPSLRVPHRPLLAMPPFAITGAGARLTRATILPACRLSGNIEHAHCTPSPPLRVWDGCLHRVSIAIGRLPGDPARTPGGLGLPRPVGGRASAPHFLSALPSWHSCAPPPHRVPGRQDACSRCRVAAGWCPHGLRGAVPARGTRGRVSMPSPAPLRAYPCGGMSSGRAPRPVGFPPERHAACRPRTSASSHTQRAGHAGMRPRGGPLLARDPANGWHLPTRHRLAHSRRVRRTPHLSPVLGDTTPVARAVCPSPPPYAGLPV